MLEKRPNRKTLATSGLVPQSYSYDDLESMDMYVSSLSSYIQIYPHISAA